MVDANSATRRRFLQGIGTAGAAGLAGCSDFNFRGSSNTGDDTVETPTATPENPALEVRNPRISIDWYRDLDHVEEIPGEHTLSVQVEQNDFEWGEIDLVLEQEKGENTERSTVDLQQQQHQFPARELFPGEQTLYLESRTENGPRQSEGTELVKDTPDAYRLDLRTPGEQPLFKRDSINDWTTPYHFDIHVFDEEAFMEQRISWLHRNKYQEVLDNPYNSHFGWDHYDDFSKEWAEREPENEEEYREILRRGQGKVRDRNGEIYSRAPSAGFANIKNTVELLFRQERDEEIIGAGVNTGGGHGLTIYYHDEWGWHIADTTTSSIGKPSRGAWQSVEEFWVPWSDYASDSNKEYHGTQRGKKTIAVGGVLGLTSVGGSSNWNFDGFFINDAWLKDAYRHIRDDGEIEPIMEPLSYAVDKMVSENSEREDQEIYTGVYGTGLDDGRVAYGENFEGLRNEIMRSERSVSAREVEEYLEQAA